MSSPLPLGLPLTWPYPRITVTAYYSQSVVTVSSYVAVFTNHSSYYYSQSVVTVSPYVAVFTDHSTCLLFTVSSYCLILTWPDHSNSILGSLQAPLLFWSHRFLYSLLRNTCECVINHIEPDWDQYSQKTRNDEAMSA